MNIFEPCTLQIGDRNYLVMKDEYDVVSLHEWKNRMSGKLHAPSSPNKGGQDEDEREDEETSESGRSSDASSVSSRSTVSSVENNMPSELALTLLDLNF